MKWWDRWQRTAWVAGILTLLVGVLGYLILFIWNFALHDTFGVHQITYTDALGWTLAICLLYLAIYLLKEDLK